MLTSTSRLANRASASCPWFARGVVLAALMFAAATIAACNPGTGFPAIKSTFNDASGPASARADGSAPPPDAPGSYLPDAPVCRDPVLCCTGPACPQRPAGSPCQSSDQCQTGSCADGVCCNVSCKGACVSCNQPDRMGECLPTAAGQPDPHLLCRTDYPASCGQSGVCNGQGGCAKYPTGVACGEAQCDGSRVMVPASECDGEGFCVAATPIPCAPFLCEGTSCRVTCTTDAQCQAPQICVNGSCGKRGRGQACTAAGQCESGFCADGVCCDTACAGKCTTCVAPASRGRCVPVAGGARDPRVARGVTDPALVCLDLGAQSCGSNGRCDGRGACEAYVNGTACAAGGCDPAKNTAAGPSVCRAGRCETAEARTCAPFVGCDGTRCSTRCVTNKDCAAGNVCLSGSCGKRPIGSVCSQDSECAGPGVCAQGRCCASTCDQTCMACNIEGAYGTCTAVSTGGADPAGTCRNDACSSGCDGKGNCRRENEGTVCGASLCNANGTLAIRTCTANGTCQPSTLTCPAGQTCEKNQCLLPKQDLGESCAENGECASGACVAGRCCATACAGACKACNAAGGWRCIDRPAETDCGNDQVCRGGQCVPRCPTGRACGTKCVDPETDPDNCGVCGLKCESRLCARGACLPACAPTTTRCGTACVQTQSDPRHCGACDQACNDKNPLCVAGSCTSTTNLPPKPDASPGSPPDAGVPEAAPPVSAPDASSDVKSAARP